LFEPASDPVQIPAEARKVYDVTGAGDTVASTLIMALTAGAIRLEELLDPTCVAGSMGFSPSFGQTPHDNSR